MTLAGDDPIHCVQGEISLCKMIHVSCTHHVRSADPDPRIPLEKMTLFGNIQHNHSGTITMTRRRGRAQHWPASTLVFCRSFCLLTAPHRYGRSGTRANKVGHSFVRPGVMCLLGASEGQAAGQQVERLPDAEALPSRKFPMVKAGAVSVSQKAVQISKQQPHHPRILTLTGIPTTRSWPRVRFLPPYADLSMKTLIS